MTSSRRWALLTLPLAWLLPIAGHAQKTTGEIVAENWERGRQLRAAADARQDTTNTTPDDVPPGLSDAQNGRAAFMFFLNSKHGVPRIVVTAFTPTRCGKPWKMAATMDTNGEPQSGCFKTEPERGTFTVDWDAYGVRTYRMSEWMTETPGLADTEALGH
ncbi:hypothetical protein [Pseudoxanthomonas mexicana]